MKARVYRAPSARPIRAPRNRVYVVGNTCDPVRGQCVPDPSRKLNYSLILVHRKVNFAKLYVMQLIDVHVSFFLPGTKYSMVFTLHLFFTIAEHVCFEVLVVFVNKNIPILTVDLCQDVFCAPGAECNPTNGQCGKRCFVFT